MRPRKISSLAITILSILLGLTFNAWGEPSPPAEGGATCVVDNPGSGAIAIRGTIAMEVIHNFNYPSRAQEVDFTLRMERSGVQHNFRLNLVTGLSGLSNEGIACRILNPDDTDDIGTDTIDPRPEIHDAVAELVNQILTAFDLPGRRLAITMNSINEIARQQPIPGTWNGSDYYWLGSTQYPAYDRGSAMVEITVYAVK